MGQKVHPTGFRLGIATDWTSKWYADSANFADFLDEDLKIREFLKEETVAGGGQPYPDFAPGEVGRGHYSYRASGHHHRQEG